MALLDPALRAAVSLAEPSESNSLVAAASWINDALLGTMATAIATIAIALIGLGMLAGRIAWRRGVMAVAGCFLIFGAPAIVTGLMPRPDPVASLPQAAPSAPAPIAQSPDENYDPYAGASLIR